MQLASWLVGLRQRFCSVERRRVATGLRFRRAVEIASHWPAQRVESLEDRTLMSASGLFGLTTSFGDDGVIVTLAHVVDPFHGVVTSVGSSFTPPSGLFPSAGGAVEGPSALDPVNHRFYFQGLGDDGTHLFVVDTQTGRLLKSPVVPHFSSLDFDAATSRLLGLTTSTRNDRLIVTLSQIVDPLIDPSHVTVTSVGSGFTPPSGLFPSASGTFEGQSALDPANNRFYFQGSGLVESPLLVIDTQTGRLLKSAVVPHFASLDFDVATGRLVGLATSFGDAGTMLQLSQVVNPFRGTVTSG